LNKYSLTRYTSSEHQYSEDENKRKTHNGPGLTDLNGKKHVESKYGGDSFFAFHDRKNP
jgi:hypothetical protein